MFQPIDLGFQIDNEKNNHLYDEEERSVTLTAESDDIEKGHPAAAEEEEQNEISQIPRVLKISSSRGITRSHSSRSRGSFGTRKSRSHNQIFEGNRISMIPAVNGLDMTTDNLLGLDIGTENKAEVPKLLNIAKSFRSGRRHSSSSRLFNDRETPQSIAKDDHSAPIFDIEKRLFHLENERKLTSKRLMDVTSKLDRADNRINRLTIELKKMKDKFSRESDQNRSARIMQMQMIPEEQSHASSTAFSHQSLPLSSTKEYFTHLNEDTFSLMKVKSVSSLSWVFSFLVYLFQMSLLFIILRQERAMASIVSNTFHIPFKVPLLTRFAQSMAIIVAIVLSRDIFVPIKEISNLWVTNIEEWSKVAGVTADETTATLWLIRILLPNLMQLIISVLVLLVSFIITIQSNNVIDIFTAFVALGVIAEIDNIVFWFFDNGYMGGVIRKDAEKVKELKVKDKTRRVCCLGLFGPQSIFFLALLTGMTTAFAFVVHKQNSGIYLRQIYPSCNINIDDMYQLGNGICDGGITNSYECGFDGGDCITFRLAYPACDTRFPEKIGDGKCHREYNVEECGYDGGDCCPKKSDEYFGDGVCHAGLFNTAKCYYDNEDCLSLRERYPFSCPDYNGEDITDEDGQPIVIGNGKCDFNKEYIEQYMNEECGWVFGDCIEIRNRDIALQKKYPNCTLEKDFFKIGDGICDGGEYLTDACGWDEYDCCSLDQFRIGDNICDSRDDNESYLKAECGFEGLDCCEKDILPLTKNGQCDNKANTIQCGWDRDDCNDFNERYPQCKVDNPALIGDGHCSGGSYNTAACGWDGGDCVVESYHECTVDDPQKIADGHCDSKEPYNTAACGWDGGDCIVEDYPDCKGVDNLLIGNGHCDNVKPYNTAKCGWDGGDCIPKDYPNCTDVYPPYVGDGQCQNDKHYNTTECGWDGGDCIVEGYPDCKIDYPALIGNGKCNGAEYNTAECGWDGGDCIPKDYPNCINVYPPYVGDGKCQNDENYNTAECGWDGGDCIVEGYPNCKIESPQFIGDGECNAGDYNTAECGWDGGDCKVEGYPNCNVKFPPLIGDGECNGEGYNTTECGWDGGDCIVEGYPNCNVENPPFVGDGVCNGGDYNTAECGWDGGDCADCKVEMPKWIGDGRCNLSSGYNTAECGWDGGDCVVEGYPDCKGVYPLYIGDGVCNGGPYNTAACGWDGGDCDIEGYPNCKGVSPALIGNGKCQNDEPYNTVECGWDGGDCIPKDYPNCLGLDPVFIGNGRCNAGGGYNTTECGWDGGDCVVQDYPNCKVDFPTMIGDGDCDNIEPYNTLECGWDGGDCVVQGYPNCKVDYPDLVGNGLCQNGEPYNTAECGWDGGDCVVEGYPDCRVDFPDLVGNGNCQNDEHYNSLECGWDGGDCDELNMLIQLGPI